jgi:CheY-like chemotaxis protein
VLVVDDNVDSADSLAMLLRADGHAVEVAYDGRGAAEAAAAFGPDVILLDIGLPGMNGYEACRAIRARPGGEAVVIAALTGWGQEDDQRKSREAGFDAHLVKPVDREALAALLNARASG